MAYQWDEIVGELYYRAKAEGLDPVGWRVSTHAMVDLRLSGGLRQYFEMHTSPPRFFGHPIVREVKHRLPPHLRRLWQSKGAEPVSIEHDYSICLECIEPHKGRTVYRDWQNGEFI